jgi:hypothetical protein
LKQFQERFAFPETALISTSAFQPASFLLVAEALMAHRA